MNEKALVLSVRKVAAIADREVSDTSAEHWKAEAVITAAVRVMSRPIGVTVADLTEAAAAVSTAPIEVIARATMQMLRRHQRFDVATFVAELAAVSGQPLDSPTETSTDVAVGQAPARPGPEDTVADTAEGED